MAKFRNIVKGTRARRAVPFRPLGADEDVPVALVPILFEDEATAMKSAIDFAKARGSTDPKPGDPLYERGLMLHIVLLSCIDVDSPIDRPEPFFASEEEIRKEVDQERVAVLFYQQRDWQNECAPPIARGQDPLDYASMIAGLAMAEEGELDRLPFAHMPRGMLLRSMQRLARSYWTLVKLSSGSGSTSPDTETTSESGTTKTDSSSTSSAPAGSAE